MPADYDWLVAELEEIVDSKIRRSELQARVTAQDAPLTVHESAIAKIEANVRTLEQDLLDYLTQVN